MMMTRRIRDKAERVVAVLDSWDEVVAVGLTATGEDLYDPYLTMSFDVYIGAEVRGVSDREGAFGDIGAFESSLLTRKDRFLMDELPVRLEYKRTERFDELIAAALRGECTLRDAGTYAFRRVVDAEVLLSRSGWLESMRGSLKDLPDRFWAQLRSAQQATVEHLFADLSAAAMREDDFYFVASSGSFLTQLCALLFTVNRAFEPSPRTLQSEALRLDEIPDSFPANLESFVRQDQGLSMSQRQELAELMVTSVFSL